jgi:hypothetical protein
LTARRLITKAVLLSDLRALSRPDRDVARRAFAWLERHPEPDGVAKRPAPPPYRPGALWAFYGPLLIQYRLSDDELTLVRVLRRLD